MTIALLPLRRRHFFSHSQQITHHALFYNKEHLASCIRGTSSKRTETGTETTRCLQKCCSEVLIHISELSVNDTLATGTWGNVIIPKLLLWPSVLISSDSFFKYFFRCETLQYPSRGYWVSLLEPKLQIIVNHVGFISRNYNLQLSRPKAELFQGPSHYFHKWNSYTDLSQQNNRLKMWLLEWFSVLVSRAGEKKSQTELLQT